MGHYSQDQTRFLLFWGAGRAPVTNEGSGGGGGCAADTRGRQWTAVTAASGRDRRGAGSLSLPLPPSSVEAIPKIVENFGRWSLLQHLLSESWQVVWDFGCYKWGKKKKNSSKNNTVGSRWPGGRQAGKVLLLQGEAKTRAEFLNLLTSRR